MLQADTVVAYFSLIQFPLNRYSMLIMSDKMKGMSRFGVIFLHLLEEIGEETPKSTWESGRFEPKDSLTPRPKHHTDLSTK
jgi:hypothetical protein